ncbi:nucleoside deaminase [Candidatus Nitrospira neomarina]|uniref:Nucleoside deaminase n=1 Tax=Candidatus Nitrospira neomarina TaxID=3020899 RepID=A0AA96GEQ5_9BACT|nr:nucleoside deaminase [Candidatus Nitrospira neomarina]WNM60488.1 nucleoside deaminase [Candidatus Nitrospira neomarina]
MSIPSIRFHPYRLELPAWVADYLVQQPETYPTQDSRMDLVIKLAQLNIQYGTGGPFGAGVFRLDTQELVAPGVNLVLSSKSSMAHAEVVAILMAQQLVGSHNLGATGFPTHELVTSCEPCCMCLGAISWSGVRQIVCGARGGDAEAVGFDEGPKPANWIVELGLRGIAVTTDIARGKAASVLQQYVQNGGVVYNGGKG